MTPEERTIVRDVLAMIDDLREGCERTAETLLTPPEVDWLTPPQAEAIITRWLDERDDASEWFDAAVARTYNRARRLQPQLPASASSIVEEVRVGLGPIVRVPDDCSAARLTKRTMSRADAIIPLHSASLAKDWTAAPFGLKEKLVEITQERFESTQAFARTTVEAIVPVLESSAARMRAWLAAAEDD